ncbi:thiamine-phosphate kinase [Candidatus Pelagibacter sp.]|nr:thiamine-phosphate kinase [Candidatus Pelagibacter sp.]
MHEFDLINNFFSSLSKNNISALGLNDDVFFDKKKNIVITVDTYTINTHFKDFKFPDLVIKKILRSSISDLICKGVKPKFYFIAGSGGKKDFTKKNLLKISRSLKNEQKKYNIVLCGGDTTLSSKLSFTITTLGYSNNIVYRNKAKLNDDIYVTGNLGDSFIGLQILKGKIKVNNKMSKFFIKKYYQPDLQLKFTKSLLKLANTSIDISDGLIDDLKKMINKQNYSFHISEKKIPVSNFLRQLIKKKNYNKVDIASKGDDYQILFTANHEKSGIIKKISKTKGIKITKIGKIVYGKNRSKIINLKNKQIVAKNKGYIHQF